MKINGRTDAYKHKDIRLHINKYIERKVDGWMNGQFDSHTGRWIDMQIDLQIDSWLNGWMDQLVGGCIGTYVDTSID
jgi:hypothetical protein